MKRSITKNTPTLLVLFLFCFCGLAQGQVPGKEDSAVGGAPHPKKGIGLSTKKHKDDWQAMVKVSGASWHYSWGDTLPGKEPAGVEFVPMIWECRRTNAAFFARIKDLTAAKSAHTRKYLLGFNEPDHQEQARMTVSQALEAWPYLMQTGLKLGSPVMASSRDWMQEFMNQAATNKYRVDFICVHLYGGPNAASFTNRLEEIHKAYGKPIWITEFGVADWKAKSVKENNYTAEQALRFMKELLPKLDALDYVERYAWFPADEDDKSTGISALFKTDGSLNALGQCYASHQYRKTKTNKSQGRKSKP